VFSPSPNVELSCNAEPIAALLHAVDLVVVITSTVGLEAAIVGRPVVSVDASVFTADTPYAAMGVSIGVARVEDLGTTVLSALASSGLVFGHGNEKRNATREVINVIDFLLCDSVDI
jgi:predicted glycosyltransferase